MDIALREIWNSIRGVEQFYKTYFFMGWFKSTHKELFWDYKEGNEITEERILELRSPRIKNNKDVEKVYEDYGHYQIKLYYLFNSLINLIDVLEIYEMCSNEIKEIKLSSVWKRCLNYELK